MVHWLQMAPSCTQPHLTLSFQSLVCLNGDVIKRETISSMPAGNAKFLLDSVFELAARINRFRLSDAEIGLFCAVVIITAGMSCQPKLLNHMCLLALFQTALVCEIPSSLQKCRKN